MRWTSLGPLALTLSALTVGCDGQDATSLAGADAGIADAADAADAGSLTTCTTVDHEAAGSAIWLEGHDAYLGVGASFYRASTAYVPRLGCNEACEVRSGEVVALDAGWPLPSSPGDLVVTGVGTSSVVLPDPHGYGGFYDDIAEGVDLADGAAVMVHGLGNPNGVPEFSAGLVAPARATVTAPGLGTTPAPRGQPFTLTWSTTSSATPDASLVVEFRGGAPSGSTPTAYAVRCEYRLGDGQGEIPAYVLSLFDAGDLELTITSEASTQVTAGDFDIRLRAEQRRGEFRRTLQLQ